MAFNRENIIMYIHIQPLVYFGGSFDPVHLGHIQTALSICKKLDISHLHLLPCGQPVFKLGCNATAQQRLEMLQLATQPHPQLKIDIREIFKTTPSYTIETLQQLRDEIPKDHPLIFVLGQDAFMHFQQWKKWQDILQLTHLIIIERPEHQTNYAKELMDYLHQHQTYTIQALKDLPYGKIYQFHAGDYPFASTQIREAIAKHRLPLGLDEKVKQYILQHGIYQTILKSS